MQGELPSSVLDVPVIMQRRRSWLRNTWFDCGYIFFVSEGDFWNNFWFPRQWADSAPQVDSRPALLSSGVEVALVVDQGSGMFFVGFTGDDAPCAVFPTFAFSLKGNHFCEPLVFCSIFSSRQTPLGGFSEPSTTKSSSLSRARGVVGSP